MHMLGSVCVLTLKERKYTSMDCAIAALRLLSGGYEKPRVRIN